MDICFSALDSYAWGIALSAHNIANVNTESFEPQRIHYATGPSAEGVHIIAITQSDGPFHSRSIQAVNNDETLDDDKALQIATHNGTDLAREITQLSMTQRSFEANSVSIRTFDEMLGTVLDIKA